MRTLLLWLFVTCVGMPAPGQTCRRLDPSGQPALSLVSPVCENLLAPAAVWFGGNPAFQLRSHAPAPVPAGHPTFLLIGIPVPPPVPIGAPLHPFFGWPGLLAMQNPLLALPAGPSGAAPGPAVPFPIPVTGGPLGLVLSVQTVVQLPGAQWALTAATGIWI